jgi:FkbM family methyltransferase
MNAQPSVERHPTLKQVARAAYHVPGTRTSARVLTRTALHSLPLSHKNRQRLYNFVAAETIPAGDINCSVRLPSGRALRLQLDLKDDLSRMWYYWGYSGYERATVRIFSGLLRSKQCVFDVGANVGYYTLLAAGMLEGRGEVHAFEPCPAIWDWLSRNLRLNRFHCVTLNQVALAEADGERPLFLPANGAGTNASLVENFTRQGSFVMAKTLRLDSYCKARVKRPVDLLKLDAEGAEMSVLRGAGAVLDECKPDVLCEVLEPFEEELDRFFSARGYRKFLITESGLQEREHLTAHHQYRDYYLSRVRPQIG